MADLIYRKREGLPSTANEIEALIRGYTAGDIPDYQMAALLMAIYFRGLNREETTALTRAMVASGEQIDLSPIPGVKVDKHSTGGVADTTTLVLAPLVAAAGVPVVKMAGRGLGHTGGTIDKLESIPGFRVQLSRQELLRQVQDIGLAITAQTGNLVPADGKLYALRDVTATVESIPLIASSVMSKKIAAGAGAIVLDVKVGSGAFMSELERARELARTMVAIGKEMGRQTVAVITNMDEPLGMKVGNALEVREAIAVLAGQGSEALLELCLTLGSQMLYLAGAAADATEGRRQLEELLAKGQGLLKLKEFISAQGGEAAVVDNPDLLPQAEQKLLVTAPGSGYISKVQARQVGEAAMLLGAGRLSKDSPIDLAVGIELKKRRGDYLEAGEPLAILHGNDPARLAMAREKFLAAYTLAETPPQPQPLVYEIIT